MPSTERRARLIRPDDIEPTVMEGGASRRRIVSKKKDGVDLAISYSRIRPGQTHDWHHHKQDEVIYCVSGRGRYDIEGGAIEYGPGEFIFLPRGTRHCNVCVSEEDVMLVAIFQPAVE